MNQKLYQVLILISLLIITFQQPLEWSEPLSIGNFELSHTPDDTDSSIIWFRLIGNNNGWVAMGNGVVQQMSNMDVVLFQFLEGEIKVTDRRALQIGPPPPAEDSEQNIQFDSENSSFVDGQWNLIWSRKIIATEENDISYECGVNNIAIAYNSETHDLVYHTNRFISELNIDPELYKCSQEEIEDEDEGEEEGEAMVIVEGEQGEEQMEGEEQIEGEEQLQDQEQIEGEDQKEEEEGENQMEGEEFEEDEEDKDKVEDNSQIVQISFALILCAISVLL
ncbi:hypothetical protein PPERSA_12384 [Pseudocohnilembus persalinus]|uniref:DOMON domain-containing protein n=1 Tax=Pseudocohnilembus persalinus TaxID=266149 RepID=A0A0V0Q8F1_PSEPJ|nr:hypothetical protein PPERSA_12384 [Pseudocohnilembus persalinus]|eukprot:KRW98427.1 hypothetical protein PPERSA_12384 [Pseudocohnilembus persalinus]